MDRLLEKDIIWRPWTHRRLIVIKDKKPIFGIIGPIHSKYKSGPSLFALADAMGEIFGPGYYGIESIEYVGFREG